MVLQVFTYLQAHQVVYFQDVQLFACQSYLSNSQYFKKFVLISQTGIWNQELNVSFILFTL